MTLTAAIILNVVFDVAILGLLGIVMSRAHRNLDVHRAEAAPASLPERERSPGPARRREAPSWRPALG